MEILDELDLENVNGGAYVGSCYRYTVQKGDILGVIAQKNGTTVSTLCDINRITNPNDIKAGAILLIPAK